jgi:hypothetical protein
VQVIFDARVMMLMDYLLMCRNFWEGTFFIYIYSLWFGRDLEIFPFIFFGLFFENFEKIKGKFKNDRRINSKLMMTLS